MSSTRQTLSVDLDKLFSELRTSPPSDTPGVYTTRDVMEKMGWSETYAKRKIKEALAQGMAEVTQKRVQAMDGRTPLVPAYRFNGVAQ